MAIAGLAERLKKDRPHRRAADLCRGAGPASTTHEARGPLAICAIDDPVEEVRLSCLDELEKQKDDAVTAYFVGRMRDKHATNDDHQPRRRGPGANQGSKLHRHADRVPRDRCTTK